LKSVTTPLNDQRKNLSMRLLKPAVHIEQEEVIEPLELQQINEAQDWADLQHEKELALLSILGESQFSLIFPDLENEIKFKNNFVLIRDGDVEGYCRIQPNIGNNFLVTHLIANNIWDFFKLLRFLVEKAIKEKADTFLGVVVRNNTVVRKVYKKVARDYGVKNYLYPIDNYRVAYLRRFNVK